MRPQPPLVVRRRLRKYLLNTHTHSYTALAAADRHIQMTQPLLACRSAQSATGGIMENDPLWTLYRVRLLRPLRPSSSSSMHILYGSTAAKAANICRTDRREGDECVCASWNTVKKLSSSLRCLSISMPSELRAAKVQILVDVGMKWKCGCELFNTLHTAVKEKSQRQRPPLTHLLMAHIAVGIRFGLHFRLPLTPKRHWRKCVIISHRVCSPTLRLICMCACTVFEPHRGVDRSRSRTSSLFSASAHASGAHEKWTLSSSTSAWSSTAPTTTKKCAISTRMTLYCRRSRSSTDDDDDADDWQPQRRRQPARRNTETFGGGKL